MANSLDEALAGIQPCRACQHMRNYHVTPDGECAFLVISTTWASKGNRGPLSTLICPCKGFVDPRKDDH